VVGPEKAHDRPRRHRAARPATAGAERADIADEHAGGGLQLPVRPACPARAGIRRRVGVLLDATVVRLSTGAARDHRVDRRPESYTAMYYSAVIQGRLT